MYAHPYDCPHVDGSWCDRIRVVAKPVGLDLVGPCWIWLGWHNAKPYNKDGSGGPYGKVWYEGRGEYIHRLMWQRHNGMLLQAGDTIDHICRVRLCFSPHHIECVDYKVNAQRRADYAAQFNKETSSHLSQEDVDALVRGW